MISIEQLAYRLGRSPRTVYRLIQHGELDPYIVRCENTYLFHEKAMEKWIDVYKHRSVNYRRSKKWCKEKA